MPQKLNVSKPTAESAVSVSINRDLNVAMEGHKTTSAGGLFHARIAARKKLY